MTRSVWEWARCCEESQRRADRLRIMALNRTERRRSFLTWATPTWLVAFILILNEGTFT